MILKNAKHENFAHLVAKGIGPTEAYIQAGYSKNGAKQSASRLLTNADVSARVEQIRANINAATVEKAGVDKAWVLSELVSNVRMAKSAEPVLDHEGNPTGEYKQNLAAANKALELIGKELGMFVDRKEIRTGDLDDVPHEEKKRALDVIREELERRADVGNGSHQAIH